MHNARAHGNINTAIHLRSTVDSLRVLPNLILAISSIDLLTSINFLKVIRDIISYDCGNMRHISLKVSSIGLLISRVLLLQRIHSFERCFCLNFGRFMLIAKVETLVTKPARSIWFEIAQ